MGTAIGVTTVGMVESELLDEAFAWFHQVDATFSTFREDSAVSRIGRHELALDDAPPEVRHVVSRCDELSESTGGRFTAWPTTPGSPAFDPAGFVKGWSVDEAALLLQAGGIERFMINAGGDILCRGSAPDGGAWRLGIRHPLEPDSVAAVVAIPGGAVATSGTYERGDHLWGRSESSRLLSVSVVGSRLGIADALATAVFVDPSELNWMANFPGYESILIGGDETVRWTSGLDDAISLTPRKTGASGQSAGDGAAGTAPKGGPQAAELTRLS